MAERPKINYRRSGVGGLFSPQWSPKSKTKEYGQDQPVESNPEPVQKSATPWKSFDEVTRAIEEARGRENVWTNSTDESSRGRVYRGGGNSVEGMGRHPADRV